ncbi:hypothetical protein MKEN_00963100 [Mycena kentingensis (nom. inval.)]|nr:hypothetical protein MKEN_00963100 [Mycena kentingensis (nom. inval.)]
MVEEIAILKAALAKRTKDVEAAERAIALLVEENRQLTEQLAESRAREETAAQEAGRRFRKVNTRLCDAEDLVDKQAEKIKELKKRVKRLEDEAYELEKERDRARERERERDKKRKRQRSPDYSSSRSRSRSRTPKRRRRSVSPPSRRPTEPSPRPQPSMPTFKKPSQRLLLNNHMSQFLHQNLENIPYRFDPDHAITYVGGAREILSSNTGSTRKFVYLPGLTLWCDVRRVHALGYAPSHEYVAGNWVLHTELAELARSGVEVDFFAPSGGRLFYAGVYRVHSLRGVKGYEPPTRIVIQELSDYELFRAMNIAEHELPRLGYPSVDDRPRVEAFGLQYLWFDREVRTTMQERGKAKGVGNGGQLQIPGSAKGKWEQSKRLERDVKVKKEEVEVGDVLG